MIKQICYILFLCSFYSIESQNWDSISKGKFSFQLERVLFDSVHNELIVSSKFLRNVNTKYVRGICRWNGLRWDSLKGGINTHDQLNVNPNGVAYDCIPYNGKLLVGGMFQSMGGVNATSLALWDGTTWDSLPKRAFRFTDDPTQVDGFLKKGNLLYIIGSFDTIAGQPAKGLATWDGTNFNAVPLPIGPGFNNISSIIEYQNEIYIAGDGFLVGANNNARDVFKFNGTSWVSTTGNGVLGGYSGVADLEVYNNELYACGHFTKTDGNAGDHIMKWNGTVWKDAGFKDQPSFVSIIKMLVYHNKLWVFGGFNEVAGSFTSNVAVYDGVNWCGLKDTLDNKITSATVYNDTIYIGGGFWKVNSDSMKFIAKLKNPTFFNSCVNVSIHELSNNNQVSIYPNPANSALNITDEQNELQNSTIEITNSIGQMILSALFNNSIDVSSLSGGCYFLHITTSDKRILHSKFIKE